LPALVCNVARSATSSGADRYGIALEQHVRRDLSQAEIARHFALFREAIAIPAGALIRLFKRETS
jgi:hypothetical protein